jgi:hypothetical protein
MFIRNVNVLVPEPTMLHSRAQRADFSNHESPSNYSYVPCQVLTAVAIEIFRDVTSCSPLSRVEVGSNASTVALRVIGGDAKGIQCLGYNRATLFLRNINTGTWPSRLGESRI